MASRSPAKNLGSAAGMISRTSRTPAGSRNARAVSSWTGSVNLAPSAVFSRIGQMVPNTIVATSIWVPIRNRAMNTGTMVTAGSARANWSTGSRTPAVAADRPRARPSAPPAAAGWPARPGPGPGWAGRS